MGGRNTISQPSQIPGPLAEILKAHFVSKNILKAL